MFIDSYDCGLLLTFEVQQISIINVIISLLHAISCLKTPANIILFNN